MSQINPLAHVVFQSIEVQRKGFIEKERQLRRARAMEKDIATPEDTLEHQVESTEEVQAVGDEAEKEKQRRKRRARVTDHEGDEEEDDDSHIDLTA